jgi:hypothetical protein
MPAMSMFILQIYQILATVPLMLEEAPYFCNHAIPLFVILVGFCKYFLTY